MRIKQIFIIILCCLFVSCGITKNISQERLISKSVTLCYTVDEESNLPIKKHLEKIDTLYLNREKLVYREVELTFEEENPNKITSYVLFLFELNDKGKRVRVDEYDIPLQPDGSLENPNHIRCGTGQPDNSWLYIYNDVGDRIETQYYLLNFRDEFEKIWRDIHSYDEKKNMIKTTRYFREDIYETSNQYDKKGNKIAVLTYAITDSTTLFNMRLRYRYNKQGDVKTEERINKSGEVYFRKNYEYIYDENKHWIKKVEYINGKPDKIRERKFEYYESNLIQKEL